MMKYSEASLFLKRWMAQKSPLGDFYRAIESVLKVSERKNFPPCMRKMAESCVSSHEEEAESGGRIAYSYAFRCEIADQNVVFMSGNPPYLFNKLENVCEFCAKSCPYLKEVADEEVH